MLSIENKVLLLIMDVLSTAMHSPKMQKSDDFLPPWRFWMLNSDPKNLFDEAKINNIQWLWNC